MIPKKDKGVAGLEILLAIVTIIFAIGFLVMIFSIMGSEIIDSDNLYDRTDSITATPETITGINSNAGGRNLSVVNLREVSCTLVGVHNGTGGILLKSGNYTQTNCNLMNKTTQAETYTSWSVNYTYTYLNDKSGFVGTINETRNAIVGVTDWFDIILIISAMVVLILLTVIIISAIKGTGGVGGNQGNMSQGKMGTA